MQDSKKNAIESLTQVPQIRQLIEEANDKTARAQTALAGAESSAKTARDTAQKAYETYSGQAAEVLVEKNQAKQFYSVCKNFFLTTGSEQNQESNRRHGVRGPETERRKRWTEKTSRAHR